MATNFLFGWDLMYKSAGSNIRRKEDLAVIFIHWNLIKKGLRAIGIGDEKALKGDEVRSETLPEGWNNAPHYTVRYVLDEKVFILHAIPTDGNLIVNFLRAENLDVSSVTIDIGEKINETSSGVIDKMIPDYSELSHVLRRDLIDAVCDKTAAVAETQTPSEPKRETLPPGLNPLLERMIPGPARSDISTRMDPFNVGRSDLDPFAPGGGGMIFNPFQPGRNPIDPGIGIPGGLPRGAVPPGARYDPIGPPIGPPMGPNPPLNPRGPLGPRPHPDSDHMRPPGNWPDNMFM